MNVVFLDTSVLGFVTHPRGSAESGECIKWMRGLIAAKVRVCVAEVCDYELRREYIRRSAEKDAQIALSKLNDLIAVLDYIPIETKAMREAAQMWAIARNRGGGTADDKRLDVDVIHCAQAKLAAAGAGLQVATTDVRDLRTYVSADTWRNVRA